LHLSFKCQLTELQKGETKCSKNTERLMFLFKKAPQSLNFYFWFSSLVTRSGKFGVRTLSMQILSLVATDRATLTRPIT